MLSLQAKIRKITGKKVENLRKKDLLPAVLYGPKIKNQALFLNYKEFEKVYESGGESTMINLKIENSGSKHKEVPVLIKELSCHPVTEKFVHIDFYQPELKEEVQVNVSLVFEGEAPAVKNLGGTLVKNLSEMEIKALPKDLPKEIKVDVSGLKTFDDNVLVKDLIVPSGVEILREPEEVVALVVPLKEEVEKPKAEKPVEEEKEIEKEQEKEMIAEK